MKITYAIHISVGSASIAKMKGGEPCIIKSDTMRDQMPMCVYFNKKKTIQVGDSAFNAHKRDSLKIQKGWQEASNSFIGFTRTLGTDAIFHSSNANRSFSSEELLTEVVKALLSFEKEENIKAAVIAVPDGFRNIQKEAVREAAKLAGLQQIEIIQESIAATLSYGLDSKKKDGFCLAFNFGSKTFSASLQKVENGIIKVIDNEGDNYLGAVNLDFAIVDNIILPYIQENYKIDSLFLNDDKLQSLRQSLRFYAADTRAKMNFEETHWLASDLGDIPGEDDEGEEFEFDITVTQNDIAKAVSPVFQKAIDVSLRLLERNNLKGTDLDSLILVGSPTLSPVLRQLLEEQICKPDTSTDPMTVVSKGAALYASTVDVSEEAREQTTGKTKIQLEVGYEHLTVEEEEFITIRILDDKTLGEIPEKVFAEVTRGDKAWSSGKIEISNVGEVIEVPIVDKMKNLFLISLIDNMGKSLLCEPNNFTIQKTGCISNATLAYNIGVEVDDKQTGKVVFRTIKGLEKNQSIPAMGTINGFKTEKPIRPTIESDFIKIPIYEGGLGADGTRAIFNDHICDIIISGSDLPCLIPENSDVDLTISVDRSERITATAYFPSIDFPVEVNIRTKHISISISQVEDLLFELTENEVLSSNEFQKYFEQLSDLKKRPDIDVLYCINTELKDYAIKT